MMAPESERPPVAETTEGQPNSVGANGNAPFAHTGAADNPETGAQNAHVHRDGCKVASIAYRSPADKIWRYTGKRGQVLAMFATMSAGFTQWVTLPWHTRLGGTIHAMRDGLAIDTQREGKFRHGRYRLVTLGRLIKQAANRQEESA